MAKMKHQVDLDFIEQIRLQQGLSNSMKLTTHDTLNNLDQVMKEVSLQYPDTEPISIFL